MTCQKCGREAEQGAKFCVDCGSPLELRCPACQTPFEFGSRFCSLCGRTLPEAEVSQQPDLTDQSSQPDRSSQPTQLSQPDQSPQLTQPTQLDPSSKPTQLAQPDQSSQATQPTQPEQPVQSSRRSLSCPRCHQENAPDAEYCFACGMPLEDSRSGASTGSAPESIFLYIPGGFWIRLFAYFVDTIVISLVSFVLVFLYGIYLAALGDDLSDFGESNFLSFLPILVRLVYEPVLIAFWATTPGKRIFGLFVIRVDDLRFGLEGLGTRHGTPTGIEIRGEGFRVGFGRALTRHLATYLSGLILCIGFLQVAFREDKLSLHDQICKTMVVKRERRPFGQ